MIDFFSRSDFLPAVFYVYSRVRMSPSTRTCAPLVRVAANSPSLPRRCSDARWYRTYTGRTRSPSSYVWWQATALECCVVARGFDLGALAVESNESGSILIHSRFSISAPEVSRGTRKRANPLPRTWAAFSGERPRHKPVRRMTGDPEPEGPLKAEAEDCRSAGRG